MIVFRYGQESVKNDCFRMFKLLLSVKQMKIQRFYRLRVLIRYKYHDAGIFPPLSAIILLHYAYPAPLCMPIHLFTEIFVNVFVFSEHPTKMF